MGRRHWLLGLALVAASGIAAAVTLGGEDFEGLRPGTGTADRLGAEAARSDGLAALAGDDDPTAGPVSDADEAPAPLAPVAQDLAGPTAPRAEGPPATDAPKRFKLAVGDALPMTPEQLAELARRAHEAAIALRRAERATLHGPSGDDTPLDKVDQKTIDRDTAANAEVAQLDGLFELEDEEAPDTTEGVTTALEGRVLDRSTGAAVVGARVALLSSFYKPHLMYDRHLSELGGGVTGVDGRFRFPAVNLDALHYRGGTGLTLVIQHDGYASWSGAPPRPITEGLVNALGDLALTPSGLALAGQIRNRDGAPLPHLLVAISPENPINVSKPQRQILLKSMPHATTDGDGRYRIDGLVPGKVWISVHATLDGVLFQEITLTQARDDVNFTVRVGGAVTGRILDRFGKAIPSARIDGSGNTTHSNADGTFLLENLDAPGPFRVSVMHHAYYLREVDDVRDGQTGLEVVLDPLPVATLLVREGEAFAPLTECEVLYNAPPAVGATIPTSPYRQSATGEYPVILYPKAASIRVYKPGFQEQTIPMTELAGGGRREIVLERNP